MSIYKDNKSRKIVTLALILVFLIILNIFRYTNNASKTYDDAVVKWYKDNWTNTDWIAIYTASKVVRRALVSDISANATASDIQKYNRTIYLTNALTILWFVLVFADIIFILRIVSKKRKEGQ